MKKLILLTLFFSATIISCTNNDDEVIADSQLEVQNACTAEKPLDLEWMQDLIIELNCGEYACKVAILKSEYEGETVFYTLVNDPRCNSVGVRHLYNCFGKKVKEFTDEESRAFSNNVEREVEEIFSCNG
ncbi:hypothetical protein [Salegentibacter mishustinae]|uniref:hypothetical protein n=1 Tax=Salegentibacter mishustinae TaxID=270918 RepID=UPI002491A933|nr:hypothetical protein [Salegentibacter mishustinae]